jgi:Flp pilus assembly protein TadD
VKKNSTLAVFFEMGKIDLSELKKQVKANPKDADLLHTYGVALVQAHGAVDDGIRQLQLALKEKPDSPEIINDLGN